MRDTNNSEQQHFWLLFCLAGLLCADVLLGPYGIVRIHDTFDWEYFSQNINAWILKTYGFSDWLFQSGGMPSHAAARLPYHPIVLLQMALPPWAAAGLSHLLLLWGGMWGTYRLLRDYFGTDGRAALLAAALSGVAAFQLLDFLVFSFLFPLFFVWLLDLREAPLPAWRRAVIILCLALMCLSSAPNHTIFFPALHMALLLCDRRNPRLRERLVVWLAAWTSYALLLSPLVGGLAQYASLAQRNYQPFGPGMAHSGGTVGLFLHAIWDLRSETRLLPLLGLGLIGLCAGCGGRKPGAAWLWGYLGAALALKNFSVPVFHGLLAHTWLAYVDFQNIGMSLPVAAALLAGLSLDALLLRWRAAGWCGVVVAVIWLCLSRPEELLLRNLFFLLPAAGLLLHTAAPRHARLALGLASAGLVGGLLMQRGQVMTNHSHAPYATAFESLAPLKSIAEEYRREPFRVGLVNLAPQVAQSYGLEAVDNNFVLFDKRYWALLKLMTLPQTLPPMNRMVNDYGTYMYLSLPEDHSISERRYLRINEHERKADISWWNLGALLRANVRYLVSSEPITGVEAMADLVAGPPQCEAQRAPLSALTGLYCQHIYVYRVRDAFYVPRVYFAQRVLSAPNEPAAAALLARQCDPADLRDTVLLDPEQHAPGTCALGQACVSMYSPDHVVVEGRTDGPATLVVATNHNPHWSALVNNAETPILRANVAFQALQLPGGAFHVVLRYADRISRLLYLLWAPGLGCLLAIAFLRCKPDATRRRVIPVSAGQTKAAWGIQLLVSVSTVVAWGGVYWLAVMAKGVRAGSPAPFAYVLASGLVLGLCACLWAVRMNDALFRVPSASTGSETDARSSFTPQ